MGTGLQGKVIIVTGETILVDGAACVKF